MQIKAGIIQPCRYESSPNFNARPPATDIDLVVLHNIDLSLGRFTGEDVIDFFLNRLDFAKHSFYQSIQELQVSAHLFIRRDGELIQFVPFELRAWHAGVSCHHGRENCNDFSIGIELEGSDDLPFDFRQYAMLMNVLRLLMTHYPKITPERIVGHCEVAPDRKTDPGPNFDWHYLKQLMSEEVCT